MDEQTLEGQQGRGRGGSCPVHVASEQVLQY